MVYRTTQMAQYTKANLREVSNTAMELLNIVRVLNLKVNFVLVSEMDRAC